MPLLPLIRVILKMSQEAEAILPLVPIVIRAPMSLTLLLIPLIVLIAPMVPIPLIALMVPIVLIALMVLIAPILPMFSIAPMGHVRNRIPGLNFASVVSGGELEIPRVRRRVGFRRASKGNPPCPAGAVRTSCDPMRRSGYRASGGAGRRVPPDRTGRPCSARADGASIRGAAQ